MGQSKTVFVMTGTETISCPGCHGELKPYDRRRRRLVDEKGARHVYFLRRLRCQKCGRLHVELPDFIVPYKRYGAKVIVSASECGKTDVPYEERTRQKMRTWFKKVVSHLHGIWRQQVNFGFVSPHIVPDFISLVRAAVNSNNWPRHPFGRTAYAL